MEKLERVQKILSNSGFCSRRKAEELIRQARVSVNNKIISLGDKASPEDKIFVDDKLITQKRKIYLMFNKPIGCVTALKDQKYRTVMHYIRIKERIFPVGRLDYNTSGLLLLTNDGDFANKVMHPRYEINKTYIVETFRPVDSYKIEQLKKGVLIEGEKTSPTKVSKLDPTLLQITIHEGKNRIIRNMLAELGIKIRALHRFKIGNLELGNLSPGRYRFLSKKDIEKIFEKNRF